MTRKLLLAAAAVAVAASSAAAQGGRHPLVGQWQVQGAAPVVHRNGDAAPPATALLTITQDGNQLVAKLETPSARTNAPSTTHVLRGVVVGDSAQFTFTAPTRVVDGKHRALRDTQVRWMISAHGSELHGSQLRVISATSELLAPSPLWGTRIGG